MPMVALKGKYKKKKNATRGIQLNKVGGQARGFFLTWFYI
jgi:hypothetical protein